MKSFSRVESADLASAMLRIIERSSTISERLGNDFLSVQSQSDEQVVNMRMETWVQAVARGDKELFHKRLAMDHLDWDQARTAVGPVKMAKQERLPGWTETLSQLLSSAAYVPMESIYGYDPAVRVQEIPFAEILFPLVRAAEEMLFLQAGKNYQLLSESAHRDLSRNLLTYLSKLCARTLVLELHLAKHRGKLQGESSKERYQNFLKDHVGTPEALLTLFEKYAVLGRIVATAVDQWVSCNAEFLLRLQTGLPAISERLFNGVEPGQVIELEDDLSDRHKNGRTVKTLHFQNGLKVLYKPKNLGLDEAYMQLVSSLNEMGMPLSLKTFQILNQGSHGWVEFIETCPCRSEAEVARYFQRCGVLLCLLYLLGTSDCHYENFIAAGDDPVLVDMETLLVYHLTFPGAMNSAENLAVQKCNNSVLRTGYLPQWVYGGKGRPGMDISGLNSKRVQLASYRKPRWLNPGTDKMRIEYQFELRERRNGPSLNGYEVIATNYVEDIVSGFSRMYSFLLGNKSKLLPPCTLFTQFDGQEMRYLNRHTLEYCLILDRTTDPDFLRDGADYSIQIDVLSRGLLRNEREHHWPFLNQEAESLVRRDIPFFTSTTNSTSLKLNAETSGGRASLPAEVQFLFREPSMFFLAERILDLSVEDMEQQAGLIRNAMQAGSPEITLQDEIRSIDLYDQKIPPISSVDMIRHAIKIAEDLSDRAVRSEDGSATWLGLVFFPYENQYQLKPLNVYLYDGTLGIALFLAALDRFAPEMKFRELALSSLQSLRRDLKSDPSRSVGRLLWSGGMIGIGSVVYGLVTIGQLLEEPELLEEAVILSRFIDDGLINSDQTFDIIGGNAGLLLALLALYRCFPDRQILTHAILCGDNLLNHRTASKDGPRVWRTLGTQLCTGFSHGASGIAYALTQLFDTTGIPKYLAAAREAFSFERSVFSKETQNWPDISTSSNEEEPSFRTSWCHGAPGIGLARVGCLSTLDRAEMENEIRISLITTQSFGLSNLNSLCCGNFSRIEFLLTAGRKLFRPDLVEEARRQASCLMKHAGQSGSYFLTSTSDDSYRPGLFQGISGVGYGLLRLADEYDRIPSVLLMQ